MGKLLALALKVKYSSPADNALEEFYIPCLNNAISYDRISGFFTSKSFVLAFAGLKEFVQNKGKIRLIAGVIPSDEMDLINQPQLENLDRWLNPFYQNLQELLANPENAHLRILAYLIKENQIQFKLALMKKEPDTKTLTNSIDPKNLKKSQGIGMMHEKIGLFYDNEGNSISFSGSLNETYYGWFYNSEEISVYNNWDPVKKEYWCFDRKKFEEYWTGERENLIIIDLPIKAKKLLVQHTPKNNDEIMALFKKVDQNYAQFMKDWNEALKNPELCEDSELLSEDESTRIETSCEDLEDDIISDKDSTPIQSVGENNLSLISPIDLEDDFILDNDRAPSLIKKLRMRPYQTDAINAWKQNNFRGIFNMATGTGKTKSACMALVRLWQEVIEQQNPSEKYLGMLCTIIVPGTTLVNQWTKELMEYFRNVISITGENFDESLIRDQFILLKTKGITLLILVITPNSFAKLFRFPDFRKFQAICVIADEVHCAGAPKIREALGRFAPRFRLGLSATPNRKFDEEGQRFLLHYFSREVFRYQLKEAIEKGYLVPYEYQYTFCELTLEEYNEYRTFSIRLYMLKNTDKPSDQGPTLEDLLIQRARILKKAEQKSTAFRRILRYIQEQGLGHNIVVFLEDYEQLEEFREIVNAFHFRVKTYDADTPKDERERIIHQISNGEIDLVFTKRCWDQGIDIPFLRVGIIVSSVSNPRQYVQRIGRLLRPSPGKELVHVFDILVAWPSDDRLQIFSCEQIRQEYLSTYAKRSSEI